MPTEDYKKYLFQRLKDREYAAGYLSECLSEGEEVFLVGLRDVVEAYGGVGALAKLTELNREGLYRMLSEQGNPTFYSLTAILDSLGIKVQFAAKLEGTEAA